VTQRPRLTSDTQVNVYIKSIQLIKRLWIKGLQRDVVYLC
jgi:hypothetical protein